MDRHIRVFERIAPIYQLFFHWQVRSYLKILRRYQSLLGIAQGNRVLDIGCGTGAFAYSLQLLGYDVTGIDASPAMVRHCSQNAVCCRQADVTEGLPFRDGSFDLVVSAYVAHGLPYSGRKRLYQEAARLTNTKVILHDFYRRNPLIDIAEYLEGGDYFRFVAHGFSELKDTFARVELVPISRWACWYICSPS